MDLLMNIAANAYARNRDTTGFNVEISRGAVQLLSVEAFKCKGRKPKIWSLRRWMIFRRLNLNRVAIARLSLVVNV